MEEIRGEGGEKMGKGTERKRVMLCMGTWYATPLDLEWI